jgi:hypothetical protein
VSDPIIPHDDRDAKRFADALKVLPQVQAERDAQLKRVLESIPLKKWRDVQK